MTFFVIYIYYKHYYLDTADIIPTLSMYWYDGYYYDKPPKLTDLSFARLSTWP